MTSEEAALVPAITSPIPLNAQLKEAEGDVAPGGGENVADDDDENTVKFCLSPDIDDDSDSDAEEFVPPTRAPPTGVRSFSRSGPTPSVKSDSISSAGTAAAATRSSLPHSAAPSADRIGECGAAETVTAANGDAGPTVSSPYSQQLVDESRALAALASAVVLRLVGRRWQLVMEKKTAGSSKGRAPPSGSTLLMDAASVTELSLPTPQPSRRLASIGRLPSNRSHPSVPPPPPTNCGLDGCPAEATSLLTNDGDQLSPPNSPAGASQRSDLAASMDVGMEATANRSRQLQWLSTGGFFSPAASVRTCSGLSTASSATSSSSATLFPGSPALKSNQVSLGSALAGGGNGGLPPGYTAHYTARLCRLVTLTLLKTPTPAQTVPVALHYIRRLIGLSSVPRSLATPTRLLLVALALADSFLSDQPIPGKVWDQIASVSGVKEGTDNSGLVSGLKRDALEALEFNLNFREEQFEQWVDSLSSFASEMQEFQSGLRRKAPDLDEPGLECSKRRRVSSSAPAAERFGSGSAFNAAFRTLSGVSIVGGENTAPEIVVTSSFRDKAVDPNAATTDTQATTSSRHTAPQPPNSMSHPLVSWHDPTANMLPLQHQRFHGHPHSPFHPQGFSHDPQSRLLALPHQYLRTLSLQPLTQPAPSAPSQPASAVGFAQRHHTSGDAELLLARLAAAAAATTAAAQAAAAASVAGNGSHARHALTPLGSERTAPGQPLPPGLPPPPALLHPPNPLQPFSTTPMYLAPLPQHFYLVSQTRMLHRPTQAPPPPPTSSCPSSSSSSSSTPYCHLSADSAEDRHAVAESDARSTPATAAPCSRLLSNGSLLPSSVSSSSSSVDSWTGSLLGAEAEGSAMRLYSVASLPDTAAAAPVQQSHQQQQRHLGAGPGHDGLPSSASASASSPAAAAAAAPVPGTIPPGVCLPSVLMALRSGRRVLGRSGVE